MNLTRRKFIGAAGVLMFTPISGIIPKIAPETLRPGGTWLEMDIDGNVLASNNIAGVTKTGVGEYSISFIDKTG